MFLGNALGGEHHFACCFWHGRESGTICIDSHVDGKISQCPAILDINNNNRVSSGGPSGARLSIKARKESCLTFPACR